MYDARVSEIKAANIACFRRMQHSFVRAAGVAIASAFGPLLIGGHIC